MERTVERSKLSPVMALILGVLVTLEIMVGGIMVFHVDMHTVDVITVVFAFLLVYFGVVTFLTDK